MGHGGHSCFFDDMLVRLEAERRMDPRFSVSPTRFEATTSSETSPSPTAGGASDNYIEHTVSKLDTLAGIAIKYGVEVSDIKRMNGLMTDLQMFAHKTLHIPLPGRHPPSAALSNNTKTPSSVPSGRPPRYGIHTSYCNSISNIYVPESKKSDKKTVSVAMSLLRGYYGLSPGQRKGNEGTEMSVYKADNKSCMDGEPSTPPQTYANDGSKDVNRMFRTSYDGDLSMKLEIDFTGKDTTKSNGIHNMGLVADVGFNEIEKTNESSVRRRSKGEGMDYSLGSTESALKQEAGLLKKKVIDAPEVLEVLHEIPHLEDYITSLYNCDYAKFFRALADVELDHLRTSRYLFSHLRYYVREMRIIAYAQLLESYRSLTMESMANSFGVSEEFIDNDVSKFIAAGRLNCVIDKVNGIVETNRPDAKNAQYQQSIKQGDILLTRIQKLSRVIDV